MLQVFHAIRDDNRGTIAVLFALVLVPAAVAGGAALDYSQLVNTRTKLQVTADEAAVVAVKAMVANLGQPAATQEQAASTAASAVIDREVPGTQKTILASATTKSVDITLLKDERTFFGKLLGRESSAVSVNAKTAYYNPPVPVCLLAMDTQGTGISFGGNSKFKGPDCVIWSNANTATASLDINGSAEITALSICAAGKVSKSNASKVSPAPKEYCGTLADPLASWTPPPAPTTCTVTNQSLTALTPNAVYCGNNTLQGTGLVLPAGRYFVKDGTLTIQSNAKIEGTGVQFITAGTGAVKVEAGTDLKLTAPVDSSGYQILLAQSGTVSLATNSFTGGSKLHLDGSIHVPSQNIGLTGNATLVVDQPSSTVVAKRITVGGTGLIEFRGREKQVAPDSSGVNKTAIRVIQ